MAEQNNPMSSESSSLPEIQRLIADAIEALAEEDNIPAEALEQLRQAGRLISSTTENATQEPHSETRIHPAGGSGLPKDNPPLSSSLNVRARKDLAKSPFASKSEISALAQDPDPDVRLCIAERKGAMALTLSHETLDALSRDEDPRIRTAVAKNAKTSVQTLLTLVQDPSPSVRKALIGRATIHNQELADELVKTSDHEALLAAAKNPETPLGLLCKLAICPFLDVRLAVARQWWQPYGVIEPALNSLAHDPDEKVRRQAAGIRLSMAKIPSMPHDLAVALVRDPDRDIRIALAKNGDLPAEVQTVLARDLEIEVRLELAKHYKLADEAAIALARDDDSQVRQTLASHEILSTKTKIVFSHAGNAEIHATAAKPRNLSDEIAITLAQDPELDVRTTLANHTSSIEALTVLAQDSDHSVRVALVNRENLPDEAQAILAQDPEVDVRTALASRRHLAGEAQVILAQDPQIDIKSTIAKRWDLCVEAFAILTYCLPDAMSLVCTPRSQDDMTQEAFALMLRTTMPINIRHPEAIADEALAYALSAQSASAPAIDFIKLDAGLADMPDEERTSVARNADNARILGRLAGDPNPEVREAAQGNIAWQTFCAVSRARIETTSDSTSRQTPDCVSEDTLLRQALANPQASSNLLARLAQFSEWDDSYRRNASPFAYQIYNNPSLRFDDVENLRHLATTNLDIALAIAYNWTAPAEILDEIARADLEKAAGYDDDYDIDFDDKLIISRVRSEIMDNPSTSPQTREFLASQVYEELFILNYEEEDEPSALDEMKEQALVSDEMLWTSAECADAYTSLRARSQLLRRAGFCDDESIRDAAELPDSVATLLDCSETLCSSSTWDALSAHFSDSFKPRFPELTEIHPHFVRLLAHDKDSRVRLKALESLGYPEDELALCEYDPDPCIRAAVARTTSNPDILKRLSSEKDPIVREGAAKNLQCQSPDLLRRLATDACATVREAVAQNQSCPVELFRPLSQDSETCVRFACVVNPACPEELWMDAVRSTPRSQRSALVSDRGIPQKRLLYLTLDLLKETGYASECNVKDLDTFGIFDQPE